MAFAVIQLPPCDLRELEEDLLRLGAELGGVDKLCVIDIEKHGDVEQTSKDGTPEEADAVPSKDRSDGSEGASVQLCCPVTFVLGIPYEHPGQPSLGLRWSDGLKAPTKSSIPRLT